MQECGLFFMSELKETVTTSQDVGIDESGNKTHKQTRKVNTNSSSGTRTIVTNIVWFILGLIEVALTFRFIFKLFGANPSSKFVGFIYNLTDLLTAPFDGIFGATKTISSGISVFEASILVAGIVYVLIGWGIVKLLSLNRES